MIQTKLDRLRFRGSVRIEADQDGYHLSYWPKGQMGNPLVGHGASGLDLECLAAQIEETTRPPWYADVEAVRYARERKAESDREYSRRLALARFDREDLRREKRARQRVENQAYRDRDRPQMYRCES